MIDRHILIASEKCEPSHKNCRSKHQINLLSIRDSMFLTHSRSDALLGFSKKQSSNNGYAPMTARNNEISWHAIFTTALFCAVELSVPLLGTFRAKDSAFEKGYVLQRSIAVSLWPAAAPLRPRLARRSLVHLFGVGKARRMTRA